MSDIIIDPQKEVVCQVQAELDEALKGEARKKYSRFVLAALGSIPWVGGFLAATAAILSQPTPKFKEGGPGRIDR